MTKEEARKLLSNTKVYVGEMREEVISKLVCLGFNLIGRNNLNGLLDPEFLYVTSHDFAGGKKLDVFFSHSYRQITMSEILDIQIDPEFKDGDVLASSSGNPFIFNGEYDEAKNPCYYVGFSYNTLVNSNGGFWTTSKPRFATEEESEKLFKAISDAGKHWNPEKKCLEDLPKEFRSFDKVLVKDADVDDWKCDFYSHKDGDNYMCVGESYWQCIPYEGNESLLGTNLPYKND